MIVHRSALEKSHNILSIASLAGTLFFVATLAAFAQEPAASKKPRALPTDSNEWKGDFEAYINKKYKTQLGNRPITVYLVPTTRDLMLQ